MLLYGSECWSVVKADMDKISVFHIGCLENLPHPFGLRKCPMKTFTNEQAAITLHLAGHQMAPPEMSWTRSPNGGGKHSKNSGPLLGGVNLTSKKTWRRASEAEL